MVPKQLEHGVKTSGDGHGWMRRMKRTAPFSGGTTTYFVTDLAPL